MEAAVEAARQLRFRDVGGIIVIDFIDMSREHHRRQVLAVLKEALSRDHAKTDMLGISKLGLVEMTRERTGRSLEAISFAACPYCRGTGRLKIISDSQPGGKPVEK
jgi:ribonuclease G